jgi:hypothetical protein
MLIGMCRGTVGGGDRERGCVGGGAGRERAVEGVVEEAVNG